jgi:hypothetical protein
VPQPTTPPRAPTFFQEVEESDRGLFKDIIPPFSEGTEENQENYQSVLSVSEPRNEV